MKKIGCVIVLYNPNRELLDECVKSILNQVDCIALIDNTPLENDFTYSNPKIYYYRIGENKGIAYAQNIGIKYFEKNHYEYILFLDQDSISPDNLVEKLYQAYFELFGSVSRSRIGGVGPRIYNRGENKKYQATIMKGKSISNTLTEVNEIISSASLIPLSHFSTVGYMDEDLFIDGVDHEWCWRAKYKKGLRFFIAENILLSHQIGEGDRWFFVKKIIIQTPFRVYFRFRNYFKLVRRDYVPFYWKASNGIKCIIKYFYYPIMVSPRLNYFYNINKGIWNGIRNKKD